jgi:glycopeptide antibiotics resistance protein
MKPEGGMSMAKKKSKSSAGVILFVIYGALMLYLLFIRNRTSLESSEYWLQVRENCNLTPFHTIRDYWHVLTNKAYYLEKWQSYDVYLRNVRHAVINLVGNVVMFVPLGYFLPKLSRKNRSFLGTFLVSAGLILAVEVMQLLTLLGSCDVDDLILNLVGVTLGFALWKLRKK